MNVTADLTQNFTGIACLILDSIETCSLHIRLVSLLFLYGQSVFVLLPSYRLALEAVTWFWERLHCAGRRCDVAGVGLTIRRHRYQVPILECPHLSDGLRLAEVGLAPSAQSPRSPVHALKLPIFVDSAVYTRFRNDFMMTPVVSSVEGEVYRLWQRHQVHILLECASVNILTVLGLCRVSRRSLQIFNI